MGLPPAGSATYGHGEHQSAIRAGMTVLVSPELPHSCNPTAGQVWSYRMMYLQTPWVLRSLGLPEPGQGGLRSNPHAFQIDQRINLSKRLLKQGHSLSEVAYRLGFSDQAHFHRHFKKRHAISPQAYLRD